MIHFIIEKWEENKSHLEEYFKKTNMQDFESYKTILEKIFELVINNGADNNHLFDTKKMTVIDDGDFQGTQIFIIPLKTRQPSETEYVITNKFYGSYSGCDTLLGISNYDDGLPSEEQVSKYMTVAIHLIQKMKWLYDENE